MRNKCKKTTATVNYGSSIDLSPTATKAGWTFVGWNTNIKMQLQD
ncbi:MAG: InlB B-repeat-containing protein [Bacilli bacterium]